VGPALKSILRYKKGVRKLKPWKLFNKTALELQAYAQFGFQTKHLTVSTF
jgi:hypothetical protein